MAPNVDVSEPGGSVGPLYIEAFVNYYHDPALQSNAETAQSNGSTHNIRISRRREDAPELNRTKVQITNMRKNIDDFVLEKQGFQILRLSSSLKTWDSEAAIKEVYFPEVTALLKHVLGASHVIQYEHHVRQKTLQEALAIDSSDAVDIAGPVRRLHIDETPASARREFEYYVKDPELWKRPFGIYNVWKPLKTVHKDPLCVVDARGMRQDDLVVGAVTVLNVGEIENYAVKKPAEEGRHEFYFLDGQMEDEALVFRILDERSMTKEGKLEKMGVAHTSFEDPRTADLTVPRESVEVRSFCVF